MLTHLGADFCGRHGFSIEKLVEELRTTFIGMALEKNLDRCEDDDGHNVFLYAYRVACMKKQMFGPE